MKKGFTLAESLVTLVVLGVVIAITIPQLNKISIDKDKTTYAKALFSIQMSMVDAMDKSFLSRTSEYLDDGTVIPPKFWADDDLSDDQFCETIAEILNTSGSIKCSGTSKYEDPNFVTTDGVRFWGLDGKFTEEINGKKSKIIYIDRKLSKGEYIKLAENRDQYHSSPGLKIVVTYDGKVKTLNTDEYAYENGIINTLNEIQK